MEQHVSHSGIKGMRWGVRKYQYYDGTYTPEGRIRYGRGGPKRNGEAVNGKKHNKASMNYKADDVVFVSGSSKTQTRESQYSRRTLPVQVRSQLDAAMNAHSKIIVGDAPGIDRQVQKYLKARKYENVEVYGPGQKVRYLANKSWKTNPIDAPEFEPGTKEWLAKKDIAMEKAATKGIAVVLDEGAKATRKNVERLSENNKDVSVYELSKEGRKRDRWTR